MKRNPVAEILAVGIVLLIAGKNQVIEIARADATTAVPYTAAPYLVEPQETKDWRLIYQNSRALILASDYHKLDAVADQFRASQETFADGSSKLSTFYQGATDLPRDSAASANFIDNLRAWIKANPNSITARVALADALVAYAWQARGNSYAYQVPEEGWKLFGERLVEARLVLRKAKTLEAKCPHWWDVALLIGRGQDWDWKTYNSVFEEGLQQAPYFNELYYEKLSNLLPRWHGGEGDWEKFALEAANKVGGEKGDILYARMIWNMDLKRLTADNAPHPGIAFDKLDAGFKALRQQFPDNLSVKSEWARLCCVIGQTDEKRSALCRVRARELFDQINAQVDTRIWTGTDEFTRMRSWARADA